MPIVKKEKCVPGATTHSVLPTRIFFSLPVKQWLCYASLARLASTLPIHCSFDNFYLIHILWQSYTESVSFRNTVRLHTRDSSGVFHKTLTIKNTFGRKKELDSQVSLKTNVIAGPRLICGSKPSKQNRNNTKVFLPQLSTFQCELGIRTYWELLLWLSVVSVVIKLYRKMPLPCS